METHKKWIHLRDEKTKKLILWEERTKRKRRASEEEDYILMSRESYREGTSFAEDRLCG